MISRITFEIKNDPGELEALIAKAGCFCESLGLSKKTSFHIKMVLEELFINIVSYGFSDKCEHFISFIMYVEDGAIVMRIEDDGTCFDPLKANKPDTCCPLEERLIGGLGLHFAKHFMDDVVYERDCNRNVITLKKSTTEK
jgi:serine/threonine-protein kinase RsbW